MLYEDTLKDDVKTAEYEQFIAAITSERPNFVEIIGILVEFKPSAVEKIINKVISEHKDNELFNKVLGELNNRSYAAVLHRMIVHYHEIPKPMLKKNICSERVFYTWPSRQIRWNALHISVAENLPELVVAILQTNIDIEMKDSVGRTALQIAVGKRNDVIVEILLKNGANPNVCNESTAPPLHFACIRNHSKIIKMLLDYKADVNLLYIGETQGVTPLHSAILHKEVVELLLTHPDIDPNIGNREGFTPVHYAIYHKKLEVLRLLLEHKNTNKKIKNKIGTSYVNYAAEVGTAEMLQLLHSFGLNFHDKDNEGWLPFEMAIIKKQVDNAIYLWEVLDCKQFEKSKFINHPLYNYFWIAFMLIPFLYKFDKMKTLAKKEAYTEYRDEIREQLKGLIQYGMQSVQTFPSQKTSEDNTETPIMFRMNFNP